MLLDLSVDTREGIRVRKLDLWKSLNGLLFRLILKISLISYAAYKRFLLFNKPLSKRVKRNFTVLTSLVN